MLVGCVWFFKNAMRRGNTNNSVFLARIYSSADPESEKHTSPHGIGRGVLDHTPTQDFPTPTQVSSLGDRGCKEVVYGVGAHRQTKSVLIAPPPPPRPPQRTKTPHYAGWWGATYSVGLGGEWRGTTGRIRGGSRQPPPPAAGTSSPKPWNVQRAALGAGSLLKSCAFE